MCYTDGEEGCSRMAGGPDMTRGRLRDENGRTTMLKELLEERRLPELRLLPELLPGLPALLRAFWVSC